MFFRGVEGGLDDHDFLLLYPQGCLQLHNRLLPNIMSHPTLVAVEGGFDNNDSYFHENICLIVCYMVESFLVQSC